MLYAPNIDPVAVKLGPLAVHWYGLAYLAGFVLAWWIASRRARQPHSAVKPEQVEDIIFTGALGVILGAMAIATIASLIKIQVDARRGVSAPISEFVGAEHIGESHGAQPESVEERSAESDATLPEAAAPNPTPRN